MNTRRAVPSQTGRLFVPEWSRTASGIFLHENDHRRLEEERAARAPIGMLGCVGREWAPIYDGEDPAFGRPIEGVQQFEFWLTTEYDVSRLPPHLRLVRLDEPEAP